MGSPLRLTSPECLVSKPRTVRNSVVFPPPLGPRTHMTSPSRSAKPTSRPMVRPGKPKASDFTSRITSSSCFQRASPAPPGEGEKPEEERRADERGEHARRHLDGGK